MSNIKLVLRIFVYVVVIFPIVPCHSHGDRSHFVTQKERAHKHDAPCASCTRYSLCVPKVQCPAHVRPGAHTPLCHLDTAGTVGVCCSSKSDHAAESDWKLQRSAAIGSEDLKSVHAESYHKLKQWMRNAEQLLDHSKHTVVNVSSPSYGHHLSMVSYDKRVEALGRGALLNLFATQELRSRQAISDDELDLNLVDHADGPFCPPLPTCRNPPPRYRSISGECNNPAYTTWGAVNTAFAKLLPPDYADGIWSMRVAKSGQPLPSARAVSSALLLDGSHPSATHNLMFMQFGQFIAHDVSAAVIFGAGNGSAISCCANDGQDLLPPELQHFACEPITVSPEDQFYGHFHHTCINFVRAQLAPSSDCSAGYAKQMNGATHYPDLSHLYGTSEEKLASLRAPGGLLKTFNDYGRDLPPLTERVECLTMRDGAACFDSGDHHGNQVISLTVLHTLWTREHNRIAKALAAVNPGWDEERVFWETRMLVQAEYQHIIYNEWLPLLLGPQIIKLFGLPISRGYSKSYYPNVNPSLTAEFSTAAMRFGHSVVDGKIIIPNPRTSELYEAISLPEVMFQPTRIRLRPFLDRLLVGLSTQPMQTVDPFVTEGLTRYMFHGGNPYGIDLASINIQRGRDYGVRSYNDYRRLIGLPPFTEFQQFPISAAQRLASVYESPEDIDLWVGGLLEEPVEGGIVGPTFAHIIADQFARLKKGDRYFYEYGSDAGTGNLTPCQLAEIKKVTLARIICDNRDGIELLHQAPEAFLRADLPGNSPVPCDSPMIPSMDLTKFKEELI